MKLFYKANGIAGGKTQTRRKPNALVAVLWEQERPNRVKLDPPKFDPEQPILLEAERQLTEYFSHQTNRIRSSP